MKKKSIHEQTDIDQDIFKVLAAFQKKFGSVFTNTSKLQETYRKNRKKYLKNVAIIQPYHSLPKAEKETYGIKVRNRILEFMRFQGTNGETSMLNILLVDKAGEWLANNSYRKRNNKFIAFTIPENEYPVGTVVIRGATIGLLLKKIKSKQLQDTKNLPKSTTAYINNSLSVSLDTSSKNKPSNNHSTTKDKVVLSSSSSSSDHSSPSEYSSLSDHSSSSEYSSLLDYESETPKTDSPEQLEEMEMDDPPATNDAELRNQLIASIEEMREFFFKELDYKRSSHGPRF